MCMRYFLFSRLVTYNLITVLKQTLYRTRAIEVELSINREHELLRDLKVMKGFNLQSCKLENLASFLLSYQQTVSQFTRNRVGWLTRLCNRKSFNGFLSSVMQLVDSQVSYNDSSVFSVKFVFLRFTVIFSLSFWHKLWIFINLATFRIAIDADFSTFRLFRDLRILSKLYGKVFVPSGRMLGRH